MNTILDLPNGYRHIAFGKIDSTNNIALGYFNNADPGKLWITAERQISGKGSRGRSWESERGNLYASLLLRLDAAPDRLAMLTFVASLALYDVIARFVPANHLALKWPNDLLLDGAKVSGILLENHSASKNGTAVIIGMGVNTASSPTEALYKSTSIKAAGISILPEVVFKHLVIEMDKWLSIWNNGNNFDAIRENWLARSVGLGEKVIAKIADSQIHGIFEDIDRNGLLILKTSDNRRQSISVADIFFSNPNQKVHNKT
jgi:BirA family biotin operon repressor/biotin-[acetyl-CoA-carboxylase] ligase